MKMSNFHSPVFWLILATAAIAVAFIVAKNRNERGWGFKDVLKNPEYWNNAEAARSEVDSAVEEAKTWNNNKVASFTKEFVLNAASSRDAWAEAKILRGLAERTHPTVLGLLRNTSLYAKLVKPTGKDILPEAPFNRACDLLGDSPEAEAVEALAPFLADPSPQIRKSAALAIAKTGSSAITPHLQKSFLDPDEYVCSHALMGLEFALTRSGLAENVHAELFPSILELLRADRNADKAADILYRLDAARAKNFFLSKGVFNSETAFIHEVLKVLANAKVFVPRSDLKSLIDSLEKQELKYPKTYALGEALRLLGQHRQEDDRDFLRRRTSHHEERVAQGAAAGLLCSFDLEGFEQRIWDTEEKSGRSALTEHQRFYSAVFMCDSEINNGGLAQYFVNSSGDQWQDALAGFKAMGFHERLAVLNEAIGKFGGGPSTDRTTRQDQLSKLYNRDDTAFDSLDDQYYKSSEVVEVLASRFVLENPESFR